MSGTSYDEDAKLIYAIQNDMGDEAAFEALYHKYYKLVLFIANRECANESDAQDILQETFIEIRKSILKLKNPRYFRLWLYRVVNSKCKDLYRSRKYVFADSDNEYIQNNVREERKDAVPESHMKFTSDQDVMMALIDELPHGQQIVLMMYYLEQCSIKEIAQILDIPEGTVKSRMANAKTALKGKIERYERQEQTKLSFYSLDALLAHVFYVGAKQAGAAAVPIRGKITWKLKSKPHMMQGVAAIGCAVAVSAVAIGYAYSNENVPKEQTFHAVNQEGRVLSTSTEAYFYLLAKACCAEEIERMSEEELIRLQAVYQSIKEENGYHYRLLKEMGWVSAYETRVLGK